MMKLMILIPSFILFLSFSAFSQNIGTEIGDIAPEIRLPNPDGDTIALSSLRGKVVLIDFWASWCGPCRRENPNVVKAYREYKDKRFTIGNGFSIYGVSLDKNKENWIKGIQTDSLTWTHVSDLKQWQCEPANVYGVTGIPSNFLIDKNGVIIAKNLRGENLEKTLEKYILKDPLHEFSNSINKLIIDFNKLKEDELYSENKELKKIEKTLKQLEESLNNLKK